MKQLLFLSYITIMIVSCSDPALVSTEELIGDWYRVEVMPQTEFHYNVSFKDGDEFIYETTYVSFAQDTILGDTTYIETNYGTYFPTDTGLEIDIEETITIDFYQFNLGIVDTIVSPNGARFSDVTFSVSLNNLQLFYNRSSFPGGSSTITENYVRIE